MAGMSALSLGLKLCKEYEPIEPWASMNSMSHKMYLHNI